jgi:ubiquinone/menaquinone biosynthesis C-methylase UbiE
MKYSPEIKELVVQKKLSGSRSVKELSMETIYEKNIKYYERNARKYEDSSWYFLNKYKNKTLRKELKQCIKYINKDCLSVLEIGPGTGYLLNKLLNIKNMNYKYTAIEHSTEMLKILEERYKNKLNNIEILNASVSVEYVVDHLAGRKFDLIIGSSILHHLPDYDGIINELARLLNLNGVIYFVREPINKYECANAKIYINIFNYIYESINAFFLKPEIKRILWPKKEKQEDTKEIAVHMFKEGISVKSFLDLCKMNYRLIVFRKYNRRASSFFSFVENKWFKWTRKDIFGNTLFAIGIQKIK